jgi:hypothetical protein
MCGRDTLVVMSCRRWGVTVAALAIAACGGGGGSPPVDAGDALDAPDDTDAGPAGFVPDPVTMGENLPAVIPVIKIAIGGATPQLDVEIPGTITIYEQHDGTLTDLATRTPTLPATPIAFQGRGNFTWSLPKKGYAFELQDGAGDALKRSILGLPDGADFALYACYTDKSCLRDALVYAVGQELGRWSPRTRFVELYIDDDYRGLYMVWERIRRDDTRVDISSTGYIIRKEGGPEGDGSDFTTDSNTYYRYHYPKSDVITAAQRTYAHDAWNAMETSIAANPAAYASVIDETSWADRAIVEEVTNNWDGYVHSIYMTKDGGVITMGPLWDFDLAFGNGNVTGYNCRTDNWAYLIQRGYPDDVPAYWLSLWADAGFQHAWKCRYQALRVDALATATFDARIATWVTFTAAARARDQARWPTIGTHVFPNCTDQPSYDAEITYLRGFISARLAWLDGQANQMPGACP